MIEIRGTEEIIAQNGDTGVGSCREKRASLGVLWDLAAKS